jgi:hypothetical protein
MTVFRIPVVIFLLLGWMWKHTELMEFMPETAVENGVPISAEQEILRRSTAEPDQVLTPTSGGRRVCGGCLHTLLKGYPAKEASGQDPFCESA